MKLSMRASNWVVASSGVDHPPFTRSRRPSFTRFYTFDLVMLDWVSYHSLNIFVWAKVKVLLVLPSLVSCSMTESRISRIPPVKVAFSSSPVNVSLVVASHPSSVWECGKICRNLFGFLAASVEFLTWFN
jgi:hypothetical protein